MLSKLKIYPFIFIILILTLVAQQQPTNIIILIGDGMGLEHIKAASLFQHGKEGCLFLESLPYKALVTTCSASKISKGEKYIPTITDSAAAATAMASGQKVYNKTVNKANPGNGESLETILEKFKKEGKKTGIITSSFLTDATPAGFGAHANNRTMFKDIAEDFFNKTTPNILFGGPNKERDKVPLTPEDGKAAGYCIITNREELNKLSTTAHTHFLGLFSKGGIMCFEYDYAQKRQNDYDTMPHLSEMSMAAINFLARNPKGFFAMIEAGNIDKAAHSNEFERVVYDTLEFDKTVQLVVEWAKQREDTLVLVVADHETGGLKVSNDSKNEKGVMPQVTWSSREHTNADVGLFAFGPGAEKIPAKIDNTDIYKIMAGTFVKATEYTPIVED